ncbi:MAG: aminoimidazole riboside kinase [Chloroflexota bacterium]|nr:aminoimidazole riboside kinase [Chloroflexota bacterium]
MPDPYVVVLGDLNVDLTLALPDRSAPASERLVREPRQTGGGTAGNTAAALARLGVSVEFAGSVGDDGFGRWLVDDLRAAGVGTRGLVVTRDAPTCQVIAMVEPDGERYLVVWPLDGGALTRLAPGDVDRGLVAGAAWLHTTGMCLRASPVASSVLTAMQVARDAGVPVSIDLNLRLELWGLDDAVLAAVTEAVDLADVVLGNGPEELVPLARASGFEVEGAEAAAQALAGSTRTVVGRLGAQGALALSSAGEVMVAQGFAADVRNPVGAGDAFNGGFIAARVAGLPLAEALRWGNAVGALKVARDGGARDQPSRAEVEALLAAD